VQVTGVIKLYRGTPEIILKEPAQLRVVASSSQGKPQKSLWTGGLLQDRRAQRRASEGRVLLSKQVGTRVRCKRLGGQDGLKARRG
jgi:DNA/RNA endonuclease YhcR with UshA esterase domain